MAFLGGTRYEKRSEIGENQKSARSYKTPQLIKKQSCGGSTRGAMRCRPVDGHSVLPKAVTTMRHSCFLYGLRHGRQTGWTRAGLCEVLRGGKRPRFCSCGGNKPYAIDSFFASFFFSTSPLAFTRASWPSTDFFFFFFTQLKMPREVTATQMMKNT